MTQVPDSLIRKLTLVWDNNTDTYLPDKTAELSALTVIEWLNDPGNREEAQALLEPFETDTQIELLEDLSQSAHKVVVNDDDTTVVAQAIGVMQVLEDLVNQAKATRG